MDQQIRSAEKTIPVDDDDENVDVDDDGDETAITTETIASTTHHFQQQDGKLLKLYNRINNDMLHAMQSQEDGKFNQLIKKLENAQNEWETVLDHLGRNILHHAVEYNNIPLVKTLLSAGININIQEGCGATPLCIAVLNRNSSMCSLLLDNFASFSGHLFASMPSPFEMAQNMELEEVVELFNACSKEDDDINNIMSGGIMDCPATRMETDDGVDGHQHEIGLRFDRSIHSQCPTAIVGDQGTCKVLRSAKNRSQEGFKWVAELPGDLHTKGYLCEAAYKAQKSGVFLYLVNKVMKRPKVVEEAFRSRKFQQQNLNRIQE